MASSLGRLETVTTIRHSVELLNSARVAGLSDCWLELVSP